MQHAMFAVVDFATVSLAPFVVYLDSQFQIAILPIAHIGEGNVAAFPNRGDW